MATSVITGSSGTAGTKVVVTLNTATARRLDDGSAVTQVVTATADGAGAWTATLEDNSNISPANSYWTAVEEIPGAPRTWTFVIGPDDALLADQLVAVLPSIPPVPAVGAGHLGSAHPHPALNGTYEPQTRVNLGALVGAVSGDGQDNTAVFQAAIDLLSSPTAHVVFYVPPGVWVTDGLKLRSNITIEGDNPGGYGDTSTTRPSILKLKPSAARPLLGDFDTSTPNFNVKIRNLQLDGNKANQSVARHGVQLYDTGVGGDYLWHIENCYIHDFKGDGIWAGTFRRAVRVTNTQVQFCDGNGITLYSTDNTVLASLIGQNTGVGIDIYASTQHITGCDIFTNLVGVRASALSFDVMLLGTVLDGSQHEGARLAGPRSVVVACRFGDNSQAGSGLYAHLDFDFPNFTALNCSVADCMFESSNATMPSYLIQTNVGVNVHGMSWKQSAPPYTIGAFSSDALAWLANHSQGLPDGVSLVLGTSAGTKIGTATTQKLGFWNAAPVVQQATTADVLAALQTLGLIGAGTPSDAAAATIALRALGATATTAAAGNDARLSDTRTPTDATVTNAKVSNTAAISLAKLNFLRPTGSIAQTFDRTVPTIADLNPLVSGRLHLIAIDLPSGVVVTSISFLSRTTPAGTPTNQWFGLFDNNRNTLRLTGDDTTTAWGANAIKTLNLSSTFTTTYAGLHYIGIMVAATTVPTLAGVNTSSGVFSGITPIIAGGSTVGQTTPGGLTSPTTALTAVAIVPYAYVS